MSYPLKTANNQRFSDVFREYKMEKLKEKWVKAKFQFFEPQFSQAMFSSHLKHQIIDSLLYFKQKRMHKITEGHNLLKPTENE